MTLMTLGLFVFELRTALFEQVSRQTDHRWSQQDRAGGPPAHQYLGPGSDTMTIEGLLMPELTGGPQSLERLRQMADQGKAWILIDGSGRHRGKWCISSVSERASHHTATGLARRIEFSLTLQRYWDDDPRALGDLRMSQS